MANVSRSLVSSHKSGHTCECNVPWGDALLSGINDNALMDRHLNHVCDRGIVRNSDCLSFQLTYVVSVAKRPSIPLACQWFRSRSSKTQFSSSPPLDLAFAPRTPAPRVVLAQSRPPNHVHQGQAFRQSG